MPLHLSSQKVLADVRNFHGAVIAHAGSENTRVFREVAQLGAELESFGDRTLGSRNEAEVGLIFDWDNYWALEYTSGRSRI